MSSNQNSINRWCLIVRRTMYIVQSTRASTSASCGKFWTAYWKAVTVDLKPAPNMACCGSWWLGSQCFTNFHYDSPMVPPCFPYDSPVVSLGSWLVPSRFPLVPILDSMKKKSGKFYPKQLTVWKYLMIKLLLTFVFFVMKNYFFNISMYGLLLVD